MRKKPRKGEALRPCPRCGCMVRFVVWQEETKARGKTIWHWAAADGSHHTCESRLTAELDAQARAHMAEIAR